MVAITITAVAVVLIVGYMVILKAVGLLAHRSGVAVTEDYFLVSRTLGTWLLVGTLAATVINGMAVTAVPALIHEDGILFLHMFLVLLAITALFALSDLGSGAIIPLVTLGASLATLLLWPLIGMFIWKGATREGVIAGMGCGLLAILLTRFTSLGTALPFGFAVGLLAFLIGSLLTRPRKSRLTQVE